MFPTPDDDLQPLLDQLDPRRLTFGVLQQIGALGNPAALPYLLAWAHSPSKGVRDAVELTLEKLLPLASTEQLLELEMLLRESWLKFYSDGHDFRAEGSAGWKLNTLSPSGWRREKAVSKLAEARDASALVFILLRLNDWVTQVRQAAECWIQRCEGSLQLAQMLECVPVLAALRERRQGGSPHFVQSLIDRLTTEEATPGLLGRLPHSGTSSRKLIFSLLSQSGALGRPETQDRLLQHSDPVMGIMLLNQLRKDFGEVPDRLIHAALPSKSALLRKNAFYCLRPAQIGRFVHSLWAALTDPAQSVRQFARFYLLRQASPEELQARHLAALQNKGASNRSMVTSILGFHECGGTWEVAEYQRWLEHPSVRVRAAVLQSFAAGHFEESLGAVRKAMASSAASCVGRTAHAILLKQPSLLSLDDIKAWLHQNQPEVLRLRGFSLLIERSKWEKLPTFLKLSRDPSKELRRRALVSICSWLHHFNKSQVQPSRDQVEEAAAELALSKSSLGAPLFQELEALLGLASRVLPLRTL